MTKSGYRSKIRGGVGFPYDDLYINGDFRLKEISATTLGLKNFANTAYRDLDVNQLKITGGQALYKHGDSYRVGVNGSVAFKVPIFTTAQRNAITPANGMLIYNSDLVAFQTYNAGQWRSITVFGNRAIVKETWADRTTLIDLDTTPTVLDGQLFECINSLATTITDFDDGVDGQEILIFFGDGNTTITHGTNIFIYAKANKTPAFRDTMTLRNISGLWYQMGGVI